jgi:ATP-binding cassette subfamily B protein
MASNDAHRPESRRPDCSNREALANIVSFVRADPAILRLLAVLFLLLLAAAVMNAAVPVFFQRIIDHFASPRNNIPVLLAAAYLCALAIAKGSAELRWRFYGRTEQRLNRRLALGLFDHVHGLSLRFHLDRRTGSLQHTVGNGMLGYCIVLQNALYVVIPLLLDLVFSGAVILALLRPVYVIILLLVAFVYILLTVRGIERNQVHQRKAAAFQVETSGLATDSYLNYETIKYFDCSDQIRKRFDDTLVRCATSWTAYYDGRTALGLMQSSTLILGLAAILVFALRDLSHGALTVGGLVLIISYYQQITRPLEGFGFAYREIATGLTYCRQAAVLMRELPDISDRPDAKPLSLTRGEVSFDHVDFAYNSCRPVLQDVSFRIPPGRTVAVVGPSGVGKSTLSRLLFRFYEVTDGTISIDGQPLTSVAIGSLRQAIAIVPQDTVLFNDTIAFNIGIARAGATRAEIEDAARLAGIADLIRSLPEGYDQVVGERGLKLSGGERQRIGIARAVLKRPRIFIFDEATSSLDSETELLIQRNIMQVARNTTTLLIAHRLSTVTHADEILVLAQGRIAERGSHGDLLQRNGIYAAMWRTQQQTRGRFAGAEDNDAS